MTRKIKKDDNKYPEAVVGALIRRTDGKLLFGKTMKWNGSYTVFGGHVEYGEKTRDAVVREVKEETGLDVKVVTQFDFSEGIFSKNFHKKKHFIFLNFLCQCKNDKNIKLNEEFEDDYVWVTVAEAKKMNLGEGTKDILKKYLDYNKNLKIKNGRTKKR